jgi:enterochelin esterase family protein
VTPIASYRSGALYRAIASLLLLSVGCLAAGPAGEKAPFSKLMELSAHPSDPKFREALAATLDPTELKEGTAWIGHGPDFLWALEAASRPLLFVDDKPGPEMKAVPGSNLWFATGKAQIGHAHAFRYTIAGKPFGGIYDFPAYTPDSYAQPGVPQGKLSGPFTFTSKVYEGMTNDYYLYVPAQYDPAKPVALMVWQDGSLYIHRDSDYNRILDSLDNLTAKREIPVIIHLFVNPGTLGNQQSELYQKITAARAGRGQGGRGAQVVVPPAMRPFPHSATRGGPGLVDLRSIQYDTVDGHYLKYLQELLPEIEKQYSIRKDPYSRAITGLSSGAICALNVAWQQPEPFTRVLSWIGSYTSIQWRSNELDGGDSYPAKVRKEAKRNIRIWLQDGTNDLENAQGSWPLQAVEMANSFKLRGYDFHLSLGRGTHNPSQGSAEFPEEMRWLWRDYDPAKTEQTFEMDAAEQAAPFFRITSLNREIQ